MYAGTLKSHRLLYEKGFEAFSEANPHISKEAMLDTGCLVTFDEAELVFHGGIRKEFEVTNQPLIVERETHHPGNIASIKASFSSKISEDGEVIDTETFCESFETTLACRQRILKMYGKHGTTILPVLGMGLSVIPDDQYRLATAKGEYLKATEVHPTDDENYIFHDRELNCGNHYRAISMMPPELGRWIISTANSRFFKLNPEVFAQQYDDLTGQLSFLAEAYYDGSDQSFRDSAVVRIGIGMLEMENIVPHADLDDDKLALLQTILTGDTRPEPIEDYTQRDVVAFRRLGLFAKRQIEYAVERAKVLTNPRS